MDTPNNAIRDYVFEFDKGVTEMMTPGGKQKGSALNATPCMTKNKGSAPNANPYKV